jgi:hypothetical protein
MTIEAVENRGLFGFKKLREEITPGARYSFVSQSTGLWVIINVITKDKISVCKAINDYGSFDVKYPSKDGINKANLIIPREGKRPIRLMWR